MYVQILKNQANQIKSQLYVLYWAFKDNRTPWYAKAVVALVLAYALSPIDLIPDFVPVLGYLDDLILIPAGIALAIKLIPPDIIAECTAKQNISNDTKRIKIGGGIIVVGLWLFIAYFIGRAVGLL
ncbi:MAG: YkvA family protein [Syntrophomonadaceae bacterium]|nr:YkvA family protein [Syntrophomonadaceae bacterium]